MRTRYSSSRTGGVLLHYETDTAPGASGSPVLNDQWEVAALHHSAVPKCVDGHYVAVGGRPWTPEMGEDRLAWTANEGVRIGQVVAALPQSGDQARRRSASNARARPRRRRCATQHARTGELCAQA
jgi:hypothetical protein